MNLFDLIAKITLDSSQYEQGLDNAGSKASSFGDKLGTAMKVGGAAVAAIGTATVAMTGAFVKGASDVAFYGDNIDKMSQKMGISAQAYQEWDAIMQHSGTSIDAMSRGMQTLQKNAVNSADKFEQLGITQEQLASMSTEELFAATIEGLQNMGEGAERTALASELLGGSAKELGALLNMSAEETEAMRQRVHELGGVMSDDAVKSSARYKDSLQDMQTAFDGLKRGMMSEFLPSITTVMDGLTELFSGGGTEKISEGISQFTDKIGEVTPKVVEVGGKIILSLVQAIAKNLPALLSAGGKAILTVVTGLIQQLPEIISSGMEVILSLANGIAESLPELIPTIVETVLAIVDGLIENIDLLVDAAIAIVTGLANGLIAAIPILIEKGPELISKLVNAIIENAPKLVESGIQVTLSLIEGLAEGFTAIVAEVGTWVSENIITPLNDAISAAVDVGKKVVDNIKEGISNAWNSLVTWFNNIWNNLFGNRKVNVDVNTNSNGTGKAIGMEYVPYNDFPAKLHKGEAVLTAREADEWRKGRTGGGVINLTQNISAVAQTPVQLAAATAAYFEQARWAI